MTPEIAIVPERLAIAMILFATNALPVDVVALGRVGGLSDGEVFLPSSGRANEWGCTIRASCARVAN